MLDLRPEGFIAKILAVLFVVAADAGGGRCRAEGAHRLRAGLLILAGLHRRNMKFASPVAAFALHVGKLRRSLLIHKPAVESVTNGVAVQALRIEFAALFY